MLGCYRKDEAHDPEIYSAAIAATLSEFPKEIIDRVTDPRTGIPAENKFLPNVAEVRAACDRETVRAREAAKPKFVFERQQYLPPVQMINLFVPSHVRGYEKIADRAAQEPDKCRYENNRLCLDGLRRGGFLVPLSWWEVPKKKEA